MPTAQNQILTDTPTPIKEKEDDSKIQFQKIKQKDFLIPATNKTPEVNFNNNGILWIKGRSIPENAYLFYSGLENWIEEYCHNPAKETSINIMLEYFNEGGYKNLLRILRNLSLLEDRGNFVIINWYYEKEDQDMKRTY